MKMPLFLLGIEMTIIGEPKKMIPSNSLSEINEVTREDGNAR